MFWDLFGINGSRIMRERGLWCITSSFFYQWNDAMKEASNDAERENAWKKIVTQSSKINNRRSKRKIEGQLGERELDSEGCFSI